MCTAVGIGDGKRAFFGRNLDYERGFGESAVIIPRNFRIKMREECDIESHFAVIGVCHEESGYPLMYDGANEMGLCMAGLNFTKSCSYRKVAEEGKHAVAPFEFILWILAKCGNVSEAAELVEKTSIVDVPFDRCLPNSKLHYLIFDKSGGIAVEPTVHGIKIYPDPVGVLTNEPEFPIQLLNLSNFSNLTVTPPKGGVFGGAVSEFYSRGMGAIGLPGDGSSMSRFARAAFVRASSRCDSGEAQNVSRLFHVLASVEQVRGTCILENGEAEFTRYSSCYSTDTATMYYRLYDDLSTRTLKMSDFDLDGCETVICDRW